MAITAATENTKINTVKQASSTEGFVRGAAAYDTVNREIVKELMTDPNKVSGMSGTMALTQRSRQAEMMMLFLLGLSNESRKANQQLIRQMQDA